MQGVGKEATSERPRRPTLELGLDRNRTKWLTVGRYSGDTGAPKGAGGVGVGGPKIYAAGPRIGGMPGEMVRRMANVGGKPGLHYMGTADKTTHNDAGRQGR